MNKKTVDFDLQRQVIATTTAIMKDYGLLWEIALKNTKSQVITGWKLERKEMVYTPNRLKIATAITSWYFDSTAKTIEVESWVDGLSIWSTLEFLWANKTSKGSLTLIVESKVSNTQFKAIYLGWDNTITLSVWDIVVEKGTTNAEWFKNSNRNGIKKPRNVYNEMHIIRVSKEISWSMASTNNWDFPKIKEELLKQWTMDFANQLNGIASSYIRTKVTIAWEEVKVAWGLPFFIENNFNIDWDVIPGTPENVKNVNWDLSIPEIDLWFKWVADNNWRVNAIRCWTTQAIKLSKLYADKVNINIVNWTVPNTVWGAVQVLKSPIQAGKNTINAVYLDISMPADELEMFLDEGLALIPKQDRALASFEIKAPTADDDNYRLSMHGEWTFYAENIKENSYKMKKLSII